jgi:hypothetical protein
MRDHLLNAYNLNANYAKALVTDIPDDRMLDQPHGIRNHPTWQLGHLVVAAHMGHGVIGEGEPAPDGWMERFAPGSEPLCDGDCDDYPDKATLLAAYEHAHQLMAAALKDVADHRLGEPNTHAMPKLLPTVGDVVTHLMTNHEAMHLGQLSAWRKAAGLPSVL